MKQEIQPRGPLSVSGLTASLRAIIESNFPFVTVTGEVSNLARPGSGHIYFSLKDDRARIRAVMFRTQQRYLDRMPKNGDEIICRGRVSLYELRGEYQIIVDTLEHAGSGALRRAFETMKARLEAEGLFAAEKKKAIPALPEKITLITSPSGAAVHDFIKTAGRRFANIAIEIMPVTVQGAAAADEISAAIKMIDERGDTGVIVLCRGGGSIEDLMPFNDEEVARTIFASRTPLVSAIGHETDFTISDLVADLRAPTPTAAAELVVPEKKILTAAISRGRFRIAELIQSRLANEGLRLQMLERFLSDPIIAMSEYREMISQRLWQLKSAAGEKLATATSRVDRARDRLTAYGPERLIAATRLRCDDLEDMLQRGMSLHLRHYRDRAGFSAAALDNLSPLAVMGRGYAVATRDRDGKLIEDAATVGKDEKIRLRLKKGGIACRVTEVFED